MRVYTHTQRIADLTCVYRERVRERDRWGAEQVREKERGTKRQPKKLKSKILNCSLTSNAIFGQPYTKVGPKGLLVEPCVWMAARPQSPRISYRKKYNFSYCDVKVKHVQLKINQFRDPHQQNNSLLINSAGKNSNMMEKLGEI